MMLPMNSERNMESIIAAAQRVSFRLLGALFR